MPFHVRNGRCVGVFDGGGVLIPDYRDINDRAAAADVSPLRRWTVLNSSANARDGYRHLV